MPAIKRRRLTRSRTYAHLSSVGAEERRGGQRSRMLVTSSCVNCRSSFQRIARAAAGLKARSNLLCAWRQRTRSAGSLDTSAFFRGPGMVVKYWDRSGLAQGMRPFHAIVVAGLARDPQAPSEADKEVERFLRDAEPPGHDEWMSTAALKDAWKPGYAKALEQLKDRITRELRELLVPKPSHGSRGPERLQKRFPIGRRGTSEGEPSAFRFADLGASFNGTRWEVSGTVPSSTAN